MFSKKDGNPVAIIKNDDGAPNEIIYIKDETDENKNDYDVNVDVLEDEAFYRIDRKKNKLMPPRDIARLKYYLMQNTPPYEENFKKPYNSARDELTAKSKYEINTGYGQHIEMLPPTTGTQRFIISGMTGSGKSTMASSYMQKYKQLHPNNDIYLFSQHDKDPVYDKIKIKIKRIPLDMLNETEITIDALKNSLVIWDDCDNVQDNALLKKIINLQQDIMSNGRHQGISCIVLLHVLMNYRATKGLLADISGVMLFLSGSKYSVNGFLKRYAGLDQQQIKSITSLKSRWFYLSMCQPMFVLSEHKAFLIK
jgi:hypothetical protein